MNWYFRVVDWELPSKGSTYMAKGELVSPGGLSFDAVSGGHGKGALPEGPYRISDCRTRTDQEQRRRMSDPAGNFWSCALSDRPEFDRDALRVHPDGNSVGTAGCIGLSQRDTLEVFRALQHSQYEWLIVEYLAPRP